MNISWDSREVAATARVVYFAVTGSLMTRIITTVTIDPVIGAISGVIFGIACTLQRKKDVHGIFNISILSALATLPFAGYCYHGNNYAIMTVAGGLTALHLTNLIAISMLF